jgi:hypothetical protein
MPEQENVLKVKVDRFEGKFAILQMDDEQIIRWPIRDLPEDAQEGTMVRLSISTAKTDEISQQQFARTFINALLNG